MSEVLNLDSVSVRRGTNFLLDDFSLTVAEGEHWAVLGPNGAGKTTLLEIAAGRMHPTTGTVNILEEQLGRVDVFEDLLDADIKRLRVLIERHAKYAGSKRAAEILANWKKYLPMFRKVMPVEYRRALREMKAKKEAERPIAIGA